MVKTYTITSKSTMLEPYWQALKDGTHPKIEYTDKQVYKRLPKEAAIMVLNEILDAPDHELSLEDVKREFLDSTDAMSDHIAKNIAAYYNGRKAIYDKLVNLLDDEFEQEKIFIPKECNSFTTQENDQDFDKIEQIEAWIEVVAE